jgi:hypothetical protein
MGSESLQNETTSGRQMQARAATSQEGNPVERNGSRIFGRVIAMIG